MQNVYDTLYSLTKKDYVRTFYTCAEMRLEDPHSDRVERCILPVDVYEKNGFGFEIMPVAMLTKHCPWDMTRTLVHIETENTIITGNLNDIVLEDAQLHEHLVALDEGRE